MKCVFHMSLQDSTRQPNVITLATRFCEDAGLTLVQVRLICDEDSGCGFSLYESLQNTRLLCTVELDEGRLMAELDDEGRDLEEAGLRIVLEEVARNRGLSGPK